MKSKEPEHIETLLTNSKEKAHMLRPLYHDLSFTTDTPKREETVHLIYSLKKIVRGPELLAKLGTYETHTDHPGHQISKIKMKFRKTKAPMVATRNWFTALKEKRCPFPISNYESRIVKQTQIPFLYCGGESRLHHWLLKPWPLRRQIEGQWCAGVSEGGCRAISKEQ